MSVMGWGSRWPGSTWQISLWLPCGEQRDLLGCRSVRGMFQAGGRGHPSGQASWVQEEEMEEFLPFWLGQQFKDSGRENTR